jgi:hypothetical protein
LIVSLPLVAKSLKVNRLRLAQVAFISLVIVTNATFLIGVAGSSARLLVAALVFFFTFIPTSLALLETISRSNQTLSLFRSLGAKKLTIAASLLVSLLGAGAVGALVGALAGSLLLAGVQGTASLFPRFLLEVGYVLGPFAAGAVAAIIFWAMFSWNRSG